MSTLSHAGLCGILWDLGQSLEGAWLAKKRCLHRILKGIALYLPGYKMWWKDHHVHQASLPEYLLNPSDPGMPVSLWLAQCAGREGLHGQTQTHLTATACDLGKEKSFIFPKAGSWASSTRQWQSQEQKFENSVNKWLKYIKDTQAKYKFTFFAKNFPRHFKAMYWLSLAALESKSEPFRCDDIRFVQCSSLDPVTACPVAVVELCSRADYSKL